MSRPGLTPHRLPHDRSTPTVVKAEPNAISLWAPEAPAEPTFNMAEYWRLLMKHRMLIAIIFVAALGVGAVATLLMTPIYTASTTFQIDRESAKVVEDSLDTGEALVAGEEFFQTQYGLLRSRSLAERVVNDLGLARTDAFLKEMGSPSADAPAASRRAAVLATVRENLGVEPIRGSRLVHVTFDSPSPALSAKVANAFADAFIKANLDRRFESSAYAREFLEERIAQTKAKLEQSERELVAYAAQQQIISLSEPGPQSAGTQSLAQSDLVALNASLAQATAARVAAEAKWRQAASRPLMGVPEVLASPTIQELSQTLAKLNAEYQQKLSRYQPEFPEMLQLKAQIDETTRQRNAAAADIRASIQSQYQAALNEENALRGRVNGLKGAVLDQRDRSVQYNILQRELDTTRTLYDGLLQRYKEIAVAGGVATNNISIVDRADVPVSPSKPNLLYNMALAAFLGLGLAVLAAFVAEALDESLLSPEDVEAKLGTPVLGAIPLLSRGTTPTTALADVRSAFSEAYYSLRTALQFSTADGAPDTLLVTSARQGEGKSTTAAAVAINLARVGARVLLVDADLRNPSLHRLLKTPNERGLSNVLSGSCSALEPVLATDLRNFSFMPCGPLPPNPAELLGGTRLGDFLQEARESFDIIVMDGPPVLGFADAPLLAAATNGTIFVVESKSTRRGPARHALRRLQVGRAKLIGAVLTKFNARAMAYGSYEYSYDYHYGLDQKPKQAART